jgi:hypothetical protein
MNRPKPDTDYCLDCEHFKEKMTHCVPNGCKKNLEIEICEGCDGGVLWERVENEDMLTATEHECFWGAPCSYKTVTGYRCPLCGHINQF